MKPHMNNPHSLRWDGWLRKVGARVRAVRGGAVRLAEHLGVSRQHAHRWLTGYTPMPAWAAVAMNIWWQTAQHQYPALDVERPPGVHRSSASGAPKAVAA